jgi:hypothetical protein
MLLVATIVLGLSAIWADTNETEVEIREKIVYSKAGDRELLLDAFVPKREGDLPAVLVVHGGAWRSGNRQQLRTYAKELAKRGIVCFAIDYRLAPSPCSDRGLPRSCQMGSSQRDRIQSRYRTVGSDWLFGWRTFGLLVGYDWRKAK